MTTLADRPNTALLVIDVQNDVVGGTHNRDGVVANIAALVGKARAAGAAVVWVQHSGEHLPLGSAGWQFVPELSRDEAEPLVPKRYADAFEETGLEAVLAEREVGRLIVTGAAGDVCPGLLAAHPACPAFELGEIGGDGGPPAQRALAVDGGQAGQPGTGVDGRHEHSSIGGRAERAGVCLPR